MKSENIMDEGGFMNLPILKEQISQFLDKNGRIVRWPKKTYDKINVLKYLQGKFDPDKKYSEIQTNSGNFIYWEIPETHHKIAMFETGFGDGYYMSLWGLNEKDEVCEVVIPFINPELID